MKSKTWRTQVHLLACFVLIFQNVYICYYVLSILKGEKTILNIVTGAGEFSGMFFTGFLMKCFSDKPLIITLVVMCLGFMACIYRFGETSPLMNYVSLYFCITAMAGAFNIAFVMTEKRTMPQVLGAMVELSVGFGTMSCLITPFILQRGLQFTVICTFCYGIPLMFLLWFLPPPLN